MYVTGLTAVSGSVGAVIRLIAPGMLTSFAHQYLTSWPSMSTNRAAVTL